MGTLLGPPRERMGSPCGLPGSASIPTPTGAVNLASTTHPSAWLMVAGMGVELNSATAARLFGGAYFNLLRRGADVNHATSEGFTPLMAAAARGDFKLVRLLIEYGANVHAKAQHGFGARFGLDAPR